MEGHVNAVHRKILVPSKNNTIHSICDRIRAYLKRVRSETVDVKHKKRKQDDGTDVETDKGRDMGTVNESDNAVTTTTYNILHTHGEFVPLLVSKACATAHLYRFTIVRNAFPIDARTLQEFRMFCNSKEGVRKTTTIPGHRYHHNSTSKWKTDARKMIHLCDEQEFRATIGLSRGCQDYVQNIKQCLSYNFHNTRHTVSNWSILWSEANCPMQKPHQDIKHECVVEGNCRATLEDYSYLASVTLTDGNNMVFFKENNIAAEIVYLRTGDIILWRDTEMHAGGCFPQICFPEGHFARLHVYVNACNRKINNSMTPILRFQSSIDNTRLHEINEVVAKRVVEHKRDDSRSKVVVEYISY